MHRDAETYSWWLAENQDQQLPAERVKLSDQIISYAKEQGFKTTAAISTALKSDPEWTRICCCDLLDQGLLQRRKQSLNGKAQRGRPSYVYGLDVFSCVMHTPPGAENEPRTITAKQTVENIAANTTNISKRQTGHLSRHGVWS